jgi:phospholipid/cholesterol/gamma-HCH transport system substrate-binding protein
MTRRPLASVVLILVVTLTGCSLTEPLRPAAAGEDQWRVSAVFDDALNLPTGAPVKVGGVPVGKVVRIAPDDYRARVDMAIDDDTVLRRGSDFRLRYTTALGELYVDVTPARVGARLEDGTLIGERDVFTAPTVEDALSSASLLVNGGSLGQVQTIVGELNTALDGRVGAARGLLTETDRFLVEALRSTREIDRVLRALTGASKLLNHRERTVNRALEDLRPAAKVLTDNTDDLARLLGATDRMAVATDHLVRRTRGDLTTIVRELGPVLDELLAEKDRIVAGLATTDRFARVLDDATPTDYLNLYFLLHIDGALGTLPDPPGPGGPPDVPGLPDLPIPELLDPRIPELPGGSGLPDVPRGLRSVGP